MKIKQKNIIEQSNKMSISQSKIVNSSFIFPKNQKQATSYSEKISELKQNINKINAKKEKSPKINYHEGVIEKKQSKIRIILEKQVVVNMGVDHSVTNIINMIDLKSAKYSEGKGSQEGNHFNKPAQKYYNKNINKTLESLKDKAERLVQNKKVFKSQEKLIGESLQKIKSSLVEKIKKSSSNDYNPKQKMNVTESLPIIKNKSTPKMLLYDKFSTLKEKTLKQIDSKIKEQDHQTSRKVSLQKIKQQKLSQYIEKKLKKIEILKRTIQDKNILSSVQNHDLEEELLKKKIIIQDAIGKEKQKIAQSSKQIQIKLKLEEEKHQELTKNKIQKQLQAEKRHQENQEKLKKDIQSEKQFIENKLSLQMLKRKQNQEKIIQEKQKTAKMQKQLEEYELNEKQILVEIQRRQKLERLQNEQQKIKRKKLLKVQLKRYEQKQQQVLLQYIQSNKALSGALNQIRQKNMEIQEKLKLNESIRAENGEEIISPEIKDELNAIIQEISKI